MRLNNNFSLFILICFLLQGCATHQSAPKALILDPAIKNAESVAFLQHSGPGEFDTYLTMNLPFAPAKALHSQIEEHEKTKLITRGEAHITVITPVEFWKVLKPAGVTIDEINRIALDSKIQRADFDVVCLGRAKLGEDLKTYFVVVDSEDLLNIRKKVQKLLIAKGGSAESFDPNRFYPHITIGYTKRDLHESDGVIKDRHSCHLPLSAN